MNLNHYPKKWPPLIILLLLCLSLTRQAYAQEQPRVTLHVRHGSLSSVLKEIRSQTGFLYGFQDQWNKLAKPIDIDVSNVALSDALVTCFKGQPFEYEIINKTIIIKQKQEVPVQNSAPAKNVQDTIRGVVLDEKKEPAPGVTVTVKGTSHIAQTDELGAFAVIAPMNSTLVFSSVNMETFELKVTSQSFLSINLKTKTSQLGEVAVEFKTGYQHIPKERATGSFDYIDSATINQQVGSNALDRLNGVASGVLFVNSNSLQNGPSNGIMIRGLSTINGLKDVLIVVDDFPYDGNISNINPNDVESFTVSKDASAASIWGVRASNGVIVITTKKGKLNRRMQVGFSAGFINTSKPDVKGIRIMKPAGYVKLEKFLFDQALYNDYDDYGQSARVYPAFSPVIEGLLAQRRGAITADSAQAILNHYSGIDARDQFAKYIYQQATTQQYNVNLSGGNSAASYYMSAGYDRNISNLAARSERYTFRNNNTFQLAKGLQLNTSIQYSQTTGVTGKPSFGSVTVNGVQLPYLQLADTKGNPTSVPLTLRTTYTDTAGAGRLLDWKYYPLEDWKHSYAKNKLEDVLANMSLNYTLLKGLSASVQYMYESQHNSIDNINDPYSYYARNLVNTFTQIDFNTGAISYILPNGGVINHTDTKVESGNLRGSLSLNRDFGKHRIDAIAGAEIRQTQVYSNSNLYYGYNSNTGASVPVDFVNGYPSYVDGSLQAIPSIQIPYQQQLYRYVSLFGNASYTYTDRYILSASARKDGSNLFGVSSNNKWNPLWSVGGAWIASKEPFYKSSLFPYLKLRATYGFSGNTNPALAAVLTLRHATLGYPSFLNESIVSNFPNPALTWERLRTTNFGIDFEAKKKSLYGSVDLYFKKGLDLYGPSPVDPTTGLENASSVTKNIANMKGRGIDVNASSRIVDKQFKWDVTFLYSYNKSEATKYNLDTTLLGNHFISNGATVNPIIGKPLYSIVAYRWAGLDDQGNPQGYLNGKISEAYSDIISKTKKEDLVYKPSLPVHFGSLINSFSYKGFIFSINISYRLGYYLMKPTVDYGALITNGASIGTSDYDKRWQNPGDETKTNVPSFIYPDDQYRDNFYTHSAANIIHADNIKLQYINFGYDFTNLSKSMKVFKSFQVYINASNLGMIWKANHDHIDPDYYFYDPVPGKTFAVGIRSTF